MHSNMSGIFVLCTNADANKTWTHKRSVMFTSNIIRLLDAKTVFLISSLLKLPHKYRLPLALVELHKDNCVLHDCLGVVSMCCGHSAAECPYIWSLKRLVVSQFVHFLLLGRINQLQLLQWLIIYRDFVLLLEVKTLRTWENQAITSNCFTLFQIYLKKSTYC